MKPKSRDALTGRAAAILRRLPATPPVVVEVGVYLGHLGEALLDARPDLWWHGVDAWASHEEHPAAYVATGDTHARLDKSTQGEIMRQALRRLARFDARATVHRAWSVDAAAEFAAGSADLVFIDADHSYDGVLSDCLSWWRAVKPGGWLSGHDINHPEPRFRFGVDDAVAEFSRGVGLPVELDEDRTWHVRKP